MASSEILRTSFRGLGLLVDVGLWRARTICLVPIQARCLFLVVLRGQLWSSLSLPQKFVHLCDILNLRTLNIISLDPSRTFSQRNNHIRKRNYGQGCFLPCSVYKIENLE